MWLGKWLLAIPHDVVLAVLWIAFLVLTAVAFFAILFTGRYPQGIFEFNVGVLRWTWRVGFYSYAALGTDRYPPFTLGEAPDYPATLSAAYPATLSRGLVLVTWWLLAIPHYLIVGILVGGGAYAAWHGDNWAWSGGGLIGLLVLFAGVSLLFTTRYPRGIFDVALGLDRWVARVAAYAAPAASTPPPALAAEAPRAGATERSWSGTRRAADRGQHRGAPRLRSTRGRVRDRRRRPDAARRRRLPDVPRARTSRHPPTRSPPKAPMSTSKGWSGP